MGQAATTLKYEEGRQKGLIRMRPPEIMVLVMGSPTQASFTAQSLPPFYHFIAIPTKPA
jgi:hypothetical protein